MNDGEYSSAQSNAYPPVGAVKSNKLKLGLIKRRPRRDTTPNPRHGSSTDLRGHLPVARSSVDLTSHSAAMVPNDRTTMVAPGIMTPPRTPSAPVYTQAEIPNCDHPHDGKEVTRVQVDLSLKEIFDLTYAGSRYLIKFLEDRKTTDISIGGLTTMESGRRGRISSFTVPIGPGATARMTQIEEWRSVSNLDAGLQAIDIEVISAGVPYGDSYSVLIHVCAKKLADNRTEFSISAKINYKKQVWKVAKFAIESLVWRQVGIFYGEMGPAVEAAARLSPEERESWKTLVFPLEAADSSPQPVVSVREPSAPAPPSSIPTERRSSARPSSANSVSSVASSLPVPYWWIMFLLLSLTWLNAFMVARLFTASPDQGSSVVQIGTAVAPPPSVPKPPPADLYPSIDWHRFVDDQKHFRLSQVNYWKRVAEIASRLMREAEVSLDTFEELSYLSETAARRDSDSTEKHAEEDKIIESTDESKR